MKDILTYEQVREGVRNVINAHPEGADHVYSRPWGEICLYVHNDKPSCIVGHYLINVLGVDKRAIREREGIGASGLAETLHARGLMPELDHRANVFLTALQGEQDRGAAWGEAYEYASARVEGCWKSEQ